MGGRQLDEGQEIGAAFLDLMEAVVGVVPVINPPKRFGRPPGSPLFVAGPRARPLVKPL